MTWIVTKINIQGIKGVLNRSGDFNLCKKGKAKSIAIFGRNAHGKSGYADAIEYLFSADGEVEHLGKGSADSEQGGKHALPHVLADEKGITPQISVSFYEDFTKETFTVSRIVNTGRNDFRPTELNSLLEKAPAYRVLRQHDLRRFVVDLAPGQKFEEFARWIGLSRATTVLKNLTTVQGTLKNSTVDREINERLQSIKDHTSGKVIDFDISLLLGWCNTEISKHIEQTTPISTVSDILTAIDSLRVKRESLISKTQIARTYLEDLSSVFSKEDSLLSILTKNVDIAFDIEQIRDDLKEKAKDCIFQEVWGSAKTFLEAQPVLNCPVCQTPWNSTVAKSQDSAIITLRESLNTLSALNEKDYKLNQSVELIKNNFHDLGSIFQEISNNACLLSLDVIEATSADLYEKTTNFHKTLTSIILSRKSILNCIEKCRELALNTIPSALINTKQNQGSPTTDEIDELINHFQGISETINRLEILHKQQESIRSIEREFIKIADKIRNETKEVADNAVDALKDDVQNIYKKIHPGEAVPNVFIRLNTTEKTLTIRVNFHSNERVVPPGGYLSEAQINTLGLALFLSSVRLFNKDFPFVFLDDIVSSYDADCRARIVDVLAEDMSKFQIFLTTHDERFYTHLRGRLEREDWAFERLSGYDFENGPRRESDNLAPEQIIELIGQGDEKIAGNAVRQFVEDWFDTMCEKYSVNTPHRKGQREYKRTLFDFWDPFVARLESVKSDFGRYVLFSVTFKRLQGGLMPIINYYCHNQTNPYEWAAIGDVEYLWDAFFEFSELFKCATCNKTLQYHFYEQRFYCTCGGAIFPTEKKLDP